MIFNEEANDVKTQLSFPIKGRPEWLNLQTGQPTLSFSGELVTLKAHEFKLLRICPSDK